MPDLPDGLEAKLVLPELKPTRALVNTGYYFLRFELTNTSDKEMTLWPFIEMEVLHADGTPVPPSMHIGRWGIISAPSRLEDIGYVQLAPGKTHTMKIALNAFAYDAHAIRGWRLVPQKSYVVKLRYEFERDAVVKEFGANCREPDAPEKPWNNIQPVLWAEEVKLDL
jgi:hypothetical protein